MKLFYTFILSLTMSSLGAQSFVFDLDQELSTSIKKLVTDHKIIAIGELHGTVESPLLMLELAKLVRETEDSITVGLEISQRFQKDLDEFMISGDVEIFKRLDHFKSNDGRSSVAMTHLLRELQSLKGIRIVCFDKNTNTETRQFDRDSIMGNNLKLAFDGHQMLILTGNLHASLDPNWMGMNRKSAIHCLKETLPDQISIISLNSYFGGGNAWNCQQEGCGIFPFGRYPMGESNGFKNFIRYQSGSIEDGFNGIIYYESAHASPPFLSDQKELEKVIDIFKQSIIKKDSIAFKNLFFDDEVSFVGVMSGLTEMSIKKDFLDFQGLAVSNSTDFIKQICQSEKPQKEEFYNTVITLDGLVASISFDYTYHSGERMMQWGNEKWNLVFTEGQWLITDVVYSIHFPDIEMCPF